MVVVPVLCVRERVPVCVRTRVGACVRACVRVSRYIPSSVNKTILVHFVSFEKK